MGHLRSQEVQTSFDRLARSTWPDLSDEQVERMARKRLSHASVQDLAHSSQIALLC